MRETGSESEARCGASSLEEIVLRNRQDCRLVRHVGLPRREDVQIPMEQEDFAAHFPTGRETGQNAALRLFNEMSEVVDDGLLLAEAGLRTEKVEGRLDFESFLISNRNCVPHRAAHHANSGKDRSDLHL